MIFRSLMDVAFDPPLGSQIHTYSPWSPNPFSRKAASDGAILADSRLVRHGLGLAGMASGEDERPRPRP
jgi:hypothetical protein